MWRKQSLRMQALHVSGSTLFSRFLGLIREYLMIQCLGASALSDIFITAYKIPNSLRKIFAEGALSAAFVPTLIATTRKDGIRASNTLMSVSLLFFETIVLLLCVFVMCKTEWILRLVAGGFSHEKIVQAIPYVRFLMPFIFFVSSSALFAGALQSVGHFFIPAFSPILLNVFFIAGLFACWLANMPIIYICLFILAGGAVQLLLHVFMYLSLNFSFSLSDPHGWSSLRSVLGKFVVCLLGVSVMEVGLFIDTSFASYLPDGSISLLYYANRFMSIPLGVFAVTISTILLPHFSDIAYQSPKRISFYVFEATKVVLFITLPVALMLGFLSQKIFYSIHLVSSISPQQVVQASAILYAFLIGLPFFSLNKILLNVFYAFHITTAPTIISVASIATNVLLNWMLMSAFQATGLALATSISLGFLTTICFVFGLQRLLAVSFYPRRFAHFICAITVQMVCILGGWYGIYYLIGMMITFFCSEAFALFMLNGLGIWLWVSPLCACAFGSLFLTRSLFKIPVYFLE